MLCNIKYGGFNLAADKAQWMEFILWSGEVVMHGPAVINVIVRIVDYYNDIMHGREVALDIIVLIIVNDYDFDDVPSAISAIQMQSYTM